MGYSLATRFSDFETIFLETMREADASLGFSLSTIIKDGPAEKLKETEITQPAILTVSTAMSRWLKTKGISGSMALGHSLGEYSALVYSESISFREAVKLVQLRGRYMQTEVPLGKGGMAALVGADFSSAEKLCEMVGSQMKGVLEISALNCPGQIVISGTSEAIDQAVSRAKDFGARMATRLEVSAPFHCSLLKGAGEKLNAILQNTTISEPVIDVVSNTTAKPEKSPDEIRENLVLQVSKPVLWENSIRYVSEQGLAEFVEVGSGKVLTGLIRKILPQAVCHPLETIESLDILN